MSGNDGQARGALEAAASEAAAARVDWLLAVSADETLASDIFVKTAPALRLHDAVWGGAGLGVSAPASQAPRHASPSPSPSLRQAQDAGGREQSRPFGGGSAKPEPITRLAAQDLPTFFHAALAWWIGPSHFVRPEAALAALQSAQGEGWYADYLVHLWRNVSAYKTAQRLTFFQGSLPPVAEADRARLIDILQCEPVYMPVRHGACELRVPYTGVNPVLEREQMRGLFFEHDELRYLSDRLPSGLRIVDAGANTGNHTLFFAAIMEAEIVIPIEPHLRAAAALRAAVAENGLENVDLSCLGVALGDGPGRLKAVHSVAGGLGATRFAPDPKGDTRLARLDALILDANRGPVDFIKIDVEGMEMAVLSGAATLIAKDRPFLYVEVLDETIGAFLAWVDINSYRVEKLFPDKTHCNYFLVPSEGRDRRGSP